MKIILATLISAIISFLSILFIISNTQSTITVNLSMFSKNNIKFPLAEMLIDRKDYKLEGLLRIHAASTSTINSKNISKGFILQVDNCQVNNTAIQIECSYKLFITKNNFQSKKIFIKSINEFVEEIYEIFEKDLNQYTKNIQNTYFSLKKNRYEGSFFEICQKVIQGANYKTKEDYTVSEIARCFDIENTFIRVYQEFLFFEPDLSEFGEPYHKFTDLNFFLINSKDKELSTVYNFWLFKVIIFSFLYFLILFFLLFYIINKIYK